MPGQQISEVDQRKIDVKFLCSKCGLLLNEPMQTPCGHLMCKSCVQHILSHANPVCPKDGISLNENNIFLDAFTKRELAALELHCLNSEDCDWFGIGKDLQSHIDSCEYTVIKCVHTSCKAKIKRSLLAEHLKECLYRSVRCQNCRGLLPFTSLEKHRAERCQADQGEIMRGFDYQWISLSEIMKTEKLYKHSQDPRHSHRQLEMQARDNRLETQMASLERYKYVEHIAQFIAGTTARFADLEPREPSQTKVNYNGVLLWKIEGYQRKRQDAINGVKTTIFSPYFYTSEFGYKMCAKIYMNGYGFRKESHLFLFFVVMKGDYDALQTWPLQKKITMMLLDQGNGDHMIHVFNSDPQSSSFRRPNSDMNEPSRWPLQIPLMA